MKDCCIEPHSLRYNLTVLSWDGSVQSGFLADGHLDGQLFLLCDRQKCPAGPQGQWAEAILRAETSNTEIEDLRENEKDLKMTLAHEKGQKGALHSLQEIRLCEIHEDGSTRGFRHFYSDGELFLSQNLDTREWNVSQSSRVQILPINITKVLEENAKKAGTVLADCLWKLRRYLASGAGIRRTVPPMVNVTRSEGSERNINVTCWASGFYPPNITLNWCQDGVSLSHDAQHSEGVLPDGNGTYQTWVTIRIRQGEEQRFTCYMEHSGNHSTHPVPSGKVPVLQRQWSFYIFLFLLLLPLLVFSVSFITRRIKHYPHSIQTGDHRDATQLGFQPLMSAPGPTGSTEGAETLQPGSWDSAPCLDLTSTFPLGASVP
uniref:MHC class I polypeptide-related sequence A isoform X3 n=1 Tax=Callithrix jacchus TaxID=9483 RepID=UPI0023DD271A|nr:MHC class I polypeptide-related sequence A isoform X3 [Callithrix jacchus]